MDAPRTAGQLSWLHCRLPAKSRSLSAAAAWAIHVLTRLPCRYVDVVRRKRWYFAIKPFLLFCQRAPRLFHAPVPLVSWAVLRGFSFCEHGAVIGVLFVNL